VRRRLQIKLANINVPHYITPLRLQTLDLGNAPPMIKSAYSLPSPEPNLVPRLVMHVVYSGACRVVIQTNVDLKESPGYVTFDKALEVFGTGAGTGGGGGVPGATAAGGGDAAGAGGDGDDGDDVGVAGAGAAAAVAVGTAVGDTVGGEGGRGTLSGRLNLSTTSTASAASTGSGGTRRAGAAARGFQSMKNMMSGGARRC
jgi:hypothetical protein